jgi:hypothetical protein
MNARLLTHGLRLAAARLRVLSKSECRLYFLHLLLAMGVNHGGGDESPQNWQWGTLIPVVPPDFCHVSSARHGFAPPPRFQPRFTSLLLASRFVVEDIDGVEFELVTPKTGNYSAQSKL